MSGNYGAVAEGFFPGVGLINSWGRGGVDKEGNLRKKACGSRETAEWSALKRIVNILRYRRQDWTAQAGIAFPNLDDNYLNKLIEEVLPLVSWVKIDDNVSKAVGVEIAFTQVLEKVVD